LPKYETNPFAKDGSIAVFVIAVCVRVSLCAFAKDGFIAVCVIAVCVRASLRAFAKDGSIAVCVTNLSLCATTDKPVIVCICETAEYVKRNRCVREQT